MTEHIPTSSAVPVETCRLSDDYSLDLWETRRPGEPTSWSASIRTAAGTVVASSGAEADSAAAYNAACEALQRRGLAGIEAALDDSLLPGYTFEVAEICRLGDESLSWAATIRDGAGVLAAQSGRRDSCDAAYHEALDLYREHLRLTRGQEAAPAVSRLARAHVIARAVLWEWLPELVGLTIAVVVGVLENPGAGLGVGLLAYLLFQVPVLRMTGGWRALTDACSEHAHDLCVRHGIATNLDDELEG
jgi:hypothetical protein